MSFDINQVVLYGRLTRDTEISYTKSNKAVCKFSIANNRGKDNDVNFFNVTAWDKLATTCNRYLKKGSAVIIAGKIRQERWQSDGQNRSKVEVVANSVQFVGSKQESQQQQSPQGQQQAQQNVDDVNFDDFGNADIGNEPVPF